MTTMPEDRWIEVPVQPDWDGLLRNLRREGTPARVHFMELFLDKEVKDAIVARYRLADGLDAGDPRYWPKIEIRIQSFLGYDYVTWGLGGLLFPRDWIQADDTVEGSMRRASRGWIDEHRGLIGSWEEFERYPWPDPAAFDPGELVWLSHNLPDGMGLCAGCHSVLEQVTWLMGYETLCYALYDEPDLVDAMFDRVGGIYLEAARIYAGIDRLDVFFGGDDMGHRTGTLIAPEALVQRSFPWHKRMARVAHDHAKLYLLHSCGRLDSVMDALIDDVGIDGKHSFEDVILPVTEAKTRYGHRVALIGGIDVDFLSRASEPEIRKRVRATLDVCQRGGGYCLGSGNSVANYIPLRNYLVMLDEGRRWSA